MAKSKIIFDNYPSTNEPIAKPHSDLGQRNLTTNEP